MKYLGLVVAVVVALAMASPAAAAETKAVIEMSYDPVGPAIGQVTDLSFRIYDPGTMKLLNHVDLETVILREDKVLYSSGLSHTHSGVWLVRQIFDKPGLYNIKAIAEMKGGSPVSYEFPLEVKEIAAGVPARLDIMYGDRVVAGKLTSIELWGRKLEEDVFLPHSDALVTIARDGMILFDSRFHTHTGKLTFSYLFPESGRYKIWAQLSPTRGPAAIVFRPVAVEKDILVISETARE